jgi:hypothetical protein
MKYKAFYSDYTIKIIKTDSDARATMKAYTFTNENRNLIALYEIINDLGLGRCVINLLDK